MEHPRRGKLALTFVVAGLALSATGVIYIVYSGRERMLPGAAGPPVGAERFQALMSALLVSLCLLLAFLVGAYATKRVGRLMIGSSDKSKEGTGYRDVWGDYRITQEELRQADETLRELAQGAGERPDDPDPPSGPTP